MNLTIALKGMDEFKKTISTERIRKEVALGIAEASLQIHSALREETVRKYRISSKEFDSMLGRPISTVKFGKDVLKGGLVYENKSKPLSSFLASVYWGNLPGAAKKRKGFVHTVEIVRGRKKIVYGKHRRGGFIPRTKGASVGIPGPTIGYGFLERIAASRFPLRALTNVNEINFLNSSLKISRVKSLLENFDKVIAEKITL